ncbi:MAG: PDZ domain-containing protein [Gemmatimonadaceae bacterium]
MRVILLFMAFSAGIAATADAQVPPVKADSTCTSYPDGRIECRVFRARGDSAFRYRIFSRMDSVMSKRAALGISLRATGTRRDTLGVFVDAVTPKGPAELAGIVEGDRIAAINGVDVRSSAADIDDDYANGLASHRLTREVQKLAPGARVTVRVYSGGRFRDVQVTAGRASDVMRMGNRFNLGFGEPDGMMEMGGPDGGAMIFRSPPDVGPMILRRPMEPIRVRSPRRTM